MRLAIERLDEISEITIDDRGDTVLIHIKGTADWLDLELPQAAYQRLVAATNEAGERRGGQGAGVRVGVADVRFEP